MAENRKNEVLVGVVSLGCSKNRVDTENLLGMLTARGFSVTPDAERADVIIVNTCGFITSAKEESIDAILDMARYRTSDEYPCSLLVVTGCLSQRYSDELAEELPEADMLWGVRDHEKLADEIAARFAMQNKAECGVPRILTTPSYSAYLRISDGCYNRCSYCAIPMIRGSLKSVPEDELLDEAKRLRDSGVTEINVIAQDTSAYGLDLYRELRLPKLLRSLSEISGLRMIRLLYAYPDTVTDELIDCILETENIANYMDMPIQHINDRVLRDMHRRSKGADIRRIISRLRSASDDFILRTSLIVGFPGETDAEFRELLDFLKEYPIDRVGAFTYSPEDNTPAAEFPNQVDEEVKEERLRELMTLQSEVSKKLGERRVGKTVEALFEGRDGDILIARSYAEAPDVDGKILVNAKDERNAPHPGEYRRVKLTAAHEYDMEGELI